MTDPIRALLNRAFDAAVRAVHPRQVVPTHLPDPPRAGRVIVLAAGKAAAAMAAAAEDHYLATGLDPERLTGIALSRYGYGRPLQRVENREGGHPGPDRNGVAGTRAIMTLADGATTDDLVLFLVSGGGSALLTAPAEGLTLADKQDLTRALLAAGAPIDAINTVRKHVSAVKGGRLARLCHPARLVTLAISDVPGDDPAVIASGPTVPDATTAADARAVLTRYGIDPGPAIRAVLDGPDAETPDASDPVFRALDVRLIARPRDALDAAAAVLSEAGYAVTDLGDRIEGEARIVAGEHANAARAAPSAGQRRAILSGGELTVTLNRAADPAGRGGPNQEYALALAMALDGRPGISALAADSDGTDGGDGAATDPAGAVVLPDTLARARAMGLDPADHLDRNDSTGFFAALGDLVAPGPTQTNVNDLRIVLVGDEAR